MNCSLHLTQAHMLGLDLDSEKDSLRPILQEMYLEHFKKTLRN